MPCLDDLMLDMLSPATLQLLAPGTLHHLAAIKPCGPQELYVQGITMGQAWSTISKKDRSQHGGSVKKDVQSLEKQDSRQSNDPQMSWNQRYTSGWRAGAFLCCAIATIILLTNVIVLVWMISNYGMENGIGTLYKGSCAQAKSLNTWLQLVVNILCTVLLGASNYCMQCLTSPTRAEIDKAHGRKRLLRIGVPSLRNLRFIGGYRAVLWVCLGLSALPLHFLYVRIFAPHHNSVIAHTLQSYNSAVFMTTQANSYTVLASPTGFFDKRFNDTKYFLSDDISNGVVDFARDLRARIEHSSTFMTLDPKQCIEEYMHQYVSNWGDLLLLQEDVPFYRISVYHYENRTCLGSPTVAWQSTQSSEFEEGSSNFSYDVCYQSVDVVNLWDNSKVKWQQVTDSASSSLLGPGWSLASVDHIFSESTDLSAIKGNTSQTFSSLPTSNPSYRWQCQSLASDCAPSIYLANATEKKDWKPFGIPVSQCIAERTPESCTLNLSLNFGLVVIACNITKVVCMFWVLRCHKISSLMTIGDAINSFLDDPDQTTCGLCLYSSAKMYLHWEWKRDSFETSLQWKLYKQAHFDDLKMPTYKVERWHWGQSASVMRWIICFVLYVASKCYLFLPLTYS